jgi:hypothetical protein
MISNLKSQIVKLGQGGPSLGDGPQNSDHPANEYLIPGRHRGCSPVKVLGFAEHLRSYASLFA